MPSLSTLPIELWLDIIELLKLSGAPGPITGVNAGWTKLTNVCPIAIGNETEPWYTANLERNWEPFMPSALGNLRLTSKKMNELCTSFQFHAVNLMKKDPDPSLEIPTRHANHIRSIRILIDPCYEEKIIEEYQRNVASLLQTCSNLQSIALYYRTAESRMECIADGIIQLMKGGNVEALGIYSVLVLHQDTGEWWWNYIHPRSPEQLFANFSTSPEVTHSLRRLDVVVETMDVDGDVYDAIRMLFPALESLTIRRGIRADLGRVWDPTQRFKWLSKSKLTHLQIIDCLAGYAPHIPELVRLFGALQFLTVSTCGNEDDVIPAPRQRGWSAEPDALCQLRGPLESFHIEHMEQWEISALGVIPTKHITLSNIKRGHFVRAMEEDSEIFPHLETLSVRPIPSLSEVDMNEENEADILAEIKEDKELKDILDSICKRRSVTVSFDGYNIKPSTGRYGFA